MSSIQQPSIGSGYADTLKKFGFNNFYECGYYWKVGASELSQGWIFTIPVWSIHFESLAQNLFPYLLSNNYSFTIPIDINVHNMLQQGILGYNNLGLIIRIYCNSETNLNTLKDDLKFLTKDYRGTVVPTCIKIGHLVYTKYGSYQTNDQKFIFDLNGNKIYDKDDIPFHLYEWIDWPFEPIVTPIIPIKGKIFNDKYLILRIIKNDLKGFVAKAIYQKTILIYLKCIIKEGQSGMFVDQYGRDIQDRIEWQKLLHLRLSSIIPIPKLLGTFSFQSNNYLVLEYIKGKSLGDKLTDLFEGNAWMNLSAKRKNIILDLVIEITKIIKKLHNEKIIHRDLNPENFLVTKNLKLYLIDLELSFDLNKNTPNPPFEKGTEGYISPEQINYSHPTCEQDIFSIGAILMISVLHMSPYRFNQSDHNLLRLQLNYFCGEKEIIELILRCLDVNPQNRPPIDKIQLELLRLKSKIPAHAPMQNLQNYISKINNCIANYLYTFNNPNILTPNYLWTSLVMEKNESVGNIRLDRTVFLGIRKGISGILYLIGTIAQNELPIDTCKEVLMKNWSFIKNFVFYEKNQLLPGLFSGINGIALGIHSLIKGKLLPHDDENVNYMIECLSIPPNTLDLSNGIAGYGITLIKCADLLPNEFVTQKLKICVDHIIKNQNNNGSWFFSSDYTTSNPSFQLTGFTNGIAGIIWFLLTYSQLYDDIPTMDKAFLGLKYLIQKKKRYKNHYIWPIEIGKNELYEFSNGGYNLVLPLIKAFKISYSQKYKDIAQSILYSYPKYITADLLSQESGLSGLGEVYLEAWLAFNNEEWRNRAIWIAGLLLNTTYGNKEKNYWLQEDPYFPTLDLLTGNSGIIHFLLRLSDPNKNSLIF